MNKEQLKEIESIIYNAVQNSANLTVEACAHYVQNWPNAEGKFDDFDKTKLANELRMLKKFI